MSILYKNDRNVRSVNLGKTRLSVTGFDFGHAKKEKIQHVKDEEQFYYTIH